MPYPFNSVYFIEQYNSKGKYYTSKKNIPKINLSCNDLNESIKNLFNSAKKIVMYENIITKTFKLYKQYIYSS